MNWPAYAFIAVTTAIELVILAYLLRWLARNVRPATHDDILKFWRDGGGQG